MPKSVGKRPKEKFVISDETHIAVPSAFTVTTAAKCEYVTDIANVQNNEEFLITSIMYNFRPTEPKNEDVLYMILRKGTSNVNVLYNYEIGDEVFLPEILQSAIWIDSKFYEQAGTDYFTIEEGKYVDIEPDVFALYEAGDRIELWMYSEQAATAVKVVMLLQGTRRLKQVVHPNDNAFSDYLWDEIVGNVAMQ